MDTNGKYKMFCAIVVFLFIIFCFFGSLYYDKGVWCGYVLGIFTTVLFYEFFIESLREP